MATSSARTARFLGILCCGLSLLVSARQAPAAIQTLGVNSTFSGIANSTGWLKAVFADAGAGQVTLTMSALNIPAGAFVSEWYFNYTPDTALPAEPTYQSDFSFGSLVDSGRDAFKADGDGKYDYLLGTSGLHGFSNGVNSTYLFSGVATGSGDFVTLSTPAGGNGPFLAAAHVQGLSPELGNSAWVALALGVDPLVSAVPEPTSLIVWSLLGATLGGVAWRRRRRVNQ